VSRRFWIAEVQIPAVVEAKLREKHDLTGDQVRGACVPDQYERAGWEDHPAYGQRLLVIALTTDGRRIKVILEPVDAADGDGDYARHGGHSSHEPAFESEALSEFDVSNEEFDERMAAAEPAELISDRWSNVAPDKAVMISGNRFIERHCIVEGLANPR